tara:strand:- start:60 stop:308 length:249 start_codon:yes stop_codon:yes gene_type:complete
MNFTNKQINLTELVDKILTYTYSNRKKIDMLLELDANQYCNSGVDSSTSYKQLIRKNSRYIYRAIQKLNYEMGRKFLHCQDK